MAHMRKVINKNREVSTDVVENKSSNVLVTIIICLAMVLFAYGASMIIYNLVKQPSTVVSSTQYNINASSTFDMSDSKYYVLFYDKTGMDALTLEVTINNYRKENSTPIYIVDLSKDYNKSIVSDTPNQYASVYSELSIANSTLMKIENGKNTGYYENVLLIEKELE